MDRVRSVFSAPERYLKGRFNIALRRSIVDELLGDLRGARVLDAGCGDGSLSHGLLERENRVVLLDLTPEMLEVARASLPASLRERATLVAGDFLTHAFPEPFDAVLAIGVLAHVPDVGGGIARIASLLAPGGRAVLQYTDHEKLTYRPHLAYQRLRRLLRGGRDYRVQETSRAGVEAALARVGLTILDERRYIQPPPGSTWVVPDDWLRRFGELTLRHPALSRHGAEVLLHVRRDA